MLKVLAALLFLPALASAEEMSWPNNTTLAATRKGLEWLAGQQQADGSFGTESLPVTRSALAGLAFVASGEERHRERVRKCFEYLLSRQAEDGWIPEPLPEKDRRAMSSGMSGQAFSLLFLATAWRTQAWWWSPEERKESGEKWRAAIDRAIHMIESSQNTKGGWGHSPRPSDADTLEDSAPVIHALACAAKAGFEVRKGTLAAARGYVDALTGDDGETGYSLSSEDAKTVRQFYLTAGGAAVLTGIDPTNAKLARGLKRLLIQRPGTGENAGSQVGGRFGSLYSALAVFQSGREVWPEWWRSQRDEHLKGQMPDGGWRDEHASLLPGPVSATAVAVIGMTLPEFPFLKLAPETPGDLLRLAEWRIRRNSWSVDISGDLTVTSGNGEKKQAYSGLLRCKPPGRLKLEGSFEGESAQDAWKLASDGATFSMDHDGTVTSGTSPARPAEFEASLSLRAGYLVCLLALPDVVTLTEGRIGDFPDSSSYAPVSSLKLKPAESLMGKPTIVLEFTVKVARRELDLLETLWLDAETFLPVKRSATGKMNDLPFRFEENWTSASTKEIEDRAFEKEPASLPK